jgi:hypothetical protein
LGSEIFGELVQPKENISTKVAKMTINFLKILVTFPRINYFPSYLSFRRTEGTQCLTGAQAEWRNLAASAAFSDIPTLLVILSETQ